MKPLITEQSDGSLLLRFHAKGHCYAARWSGTKAQALLAWQTEGIRCLPYNETNGWFFGKRRYRTFKARQDSSLVVCPDCNAIVSLRFPIHNCQSNRTAAMGFTNP